MRVPRPNRIIITVLAVVLGTAGGFLLTPPRSKQKPFHLANPSRLTPAPAASGVVISTPAETPTETAKGETNRPPGGVLPLPAPPVAADELSEDTVVKLRELAEADPAALAESALNQPVSRLRERMLLEALPLWVERDPVAATKWLGQHAPAREFDLGISAVVHHPTMLTLPPTVSLGLACDIIDGSLRISTLRSVVQTWSHRDASQLRTALEHAPDLSTAERATLLAELTELTGAR